MAGLKPRFALCALAACAAGWHASAAAQALPTPSRTMYKCTANKVISYSDKPCLGAERLVVTPTRGVSKLSGKEKIGADELYERHREQMADALRPISGMTREEYALYGRRIKLSAAAQQECRQLDPLQLRLEAQEKAAEKTEKPSIQHELFILRQRYTELGC